MHERLIVSDVRAVEAAARLDRASMERDVALTRAMELEAVLAASQQSLEMLERRVLDAEREARASTSASDRELVERLVARAEHAEAAFAVAQEELASRAESAVTEVDLRVEDLSSIVGRAERAEAELARIADELAHLGDAHGLEAAGYESQLQDRARFVAALEKELLRREQLVKELVASLEAQAEKSDPAGPRVFETSAPLPAPPVPTVGAAELATLRAKLDELATEIARRDGELTARGWRITELENERERLLRQVEGQPAERQEAAKPGTLQHAGSATVDELNALRQALAQEHAARVAAESGEELSRARAELARQSALLEQIRGQRESSRS